MEATRKRSRRWWRSLLAPVLALALAAPVSAAPVAIDSPQAAANGAQAQRAIEVAVAKAEVERELEAKLAGGGKATFMVKLRVQADTEQAALAARNRVAALGAGAKAQKVAQGTAVVRALQETAKAEQAGLERLLASLKAAGHVDSYEQFWIVNAISVTGDAKALAEIAARPEVEKVVESRTYQLLHDANFELTTEAIAQATNEWGIEYIDAPTVWDMGYDGTGIVIANIDTGVEVTHPDLVNQFRGTGSDNMAAHWFDAINGRPEPYDDNGHGTHTAGTAVGANGIGVAPGAQFIAVKMLSAGGTGGAEGILRAGQWVLAPAGDTSLAPDIASNSWGGGPELDEWFRPTVQQWRLAGILPVFANGNTRPGQTHCFVVDPAMYPESFGVGNIQRDGSINPDSCHGPSPDPYNEIKPDVSAPGTAVRSSFPGGGYATGSGTSMAAPHVAGAAALLKQINYSLSPTDLENLLMDTAVPHEDDNWPGHPNNGYGYGVINVAAAAGEIAEGTGYVVGQVLYDADDVMAPEISGHTPITAAYAGYDIDFVAYVADDYIMGDVTLVIGEDRYPLEQVSGDHRAGRFAMTLPGDAVQVPGFTYYLEATDAAGNVGRTPDYEVVVTRGVQVGYFNDFEAQITGWTITGVNSSWQWGEPLVGPEAYSGTKVVATNLAGDYLPGANASFVSPPIDLTEVERAAVSFMQWYNFENGWDFGRLIVIDGEGQEHPLMQITGVGETWHKAAFDLSRFSGQVIHLAFQQTSDGGINRRGWYLDDFYLFGPEDSVLPGAPTGLEAAADSFGDVHLTWRAVPEAQGYVIHRSAGPGEGFVEVGRSEAPNYTDVSVDASGTYQYRVTATDVFGSEGAPSAEAEVAVSIGSVVFYDDFAAPGAWTTGGTGTPWELGMPTLGPGPLTGEQLWATNLSGVYVNNSNTWLMSEVIDLSGVSEASLRFSHWYALENTWDYAYVEVSTDGGESWQQLGSRYTGLIRAWQRPTLDLTAYAGQQIQLRFRMTSDVSNTFEGWYIDNVKIVSQTAETEALAVEPDKAAEKVDQSLLLGKPAAPAAAATFEVTPAAIPAEATVTVVETGISTVTNPLTGQYRLLHRAGTFTLRAEAYGHYPTEATVEIPDGGEVTQVLLMTPIPKGQLYGRVTNAANGQPVANATIMQVEDGRVAPVTTDADGRYSMNLLIGDYTVMVGAEHYTSANFSVTITEAGYELNVELEPSIGLPDEIKYDDGIPENAYVWLAAGAAYAVRMTPDATKGAAHLNAASYYFWSSDFPIPGGDTIYVSVWAADGPGGSPGTQLVEPMRVTVDRGAWTVVDLSQFGLTFTGDFYVGFEQADIGDLSPAIGLDESSPGDRSWSRLGGEWDLAVNWDSDIFGAHMIRAQVAYRVAEPVIDSPADGSFTNVADVLVEGNSADGATITIYNGDGVAGSSEVVAGRFSVPVTLNPGPNVLAATATFDGVEGRRGPAITVIFHDQAPELSITSPADGHVTNREAIEIIGQAVSPYLAQVTVNGETVATDDEGNFNHRILLNPGANEVTVVATDLATNEASVTITVYSVTEGPGINNIEPSEDVTLKTGQSLTISFTSDPGLAAAGYRIILAGLAGGETETGNMTEVEPGVYEGTFIAPEDTQFANAIIEVYAQDAAGNVTTAQAAGRLTVEMGEEEEPPTPQPPHAEMLFATNNIRAGQRVMVNGLPSRSPNGKIVQYLWDFGDGHTASGVAVNHIWRVAGTYTVTLTVVDEAGEMASTTKTIEVR